MPAEPTTPANPGSFLSPPEIHLPVIYFSASKAWFGLRTGSKSKKIKSPRATLLLLLPRTDIHTHSHSPFLPTPEHALGHPKSQEALWGPASDRSCSHVPPLSPRPNVHKSPSACAQSAFGDKFSKPPAPAPHPPTLALKARGSARAQAPSPADNTPATPAFPEHTLAGLATTLSSPKVPTEQGAS